MCKNLWVLWAGNDEGVLGIELTAAVVAVDPFTSIAWPEVAASPMSKIDEVVQLGVEPESLV